MKKIISITLLIIWLLTIYYFSNQHGDISSMLSNNVNNVISFINVLYIRKLAHVFLYFILGVLVINVLDLYNVKNLFFYSFVFCILYSISDELHQYFIPLRDCRIIDVLIDSISSYIGIKTYILLKNKLF